MEKAERTPIMRIVWALCLAAALSLCLGARQALAEELTTRLGGQTRYETMRSVVTEGFGKSVWAVVATGQNYPDALSSSSLAGTLGCPVILTRPEALSGEASSELVRLGVDSVILMGGEAAVASSVESQIESLGIDVTRLAGSDRVDTSLKVYAVVRELGSSSDTVIIATGDGFADSLSIGPWSWKTSSPIVLARSGKLSERAVETIRADGNVRRVLIVGGTSAVSEDVRSQLGDSYSYVRLEGPNRYETSRKIAEWECCNGLSWTTPAVSTGENFPDALAGAAFCGAKGSPIVLTAPVSTVGTTLLGDHYADAARCYVLGGPSAVGYGQQMLLYWSLYLGQACPPFAVDAWTKAWSGVMDYDETATDDEWDIVLIESPDGTQALFFELNGFMEEYRCRFGYKTMGPDGKVYIEEETDDHDWVYELLEARDDGSLVIRIGGGECVLTPVGRGDSGIGSVADAWQYIAESVL